MADLTTNFAGIRCPNPFWLASGPPTNCGEQVMRAFDAGWGGAVWKTIGEPIVNVSSRYSSVDWNGQRMMGLNNIELISDRSIETNLREIAEVKKRYPHHAVIASLMVDSKREVWHDIVKRSEDAGADGLELNFGCPHGMSERGMGSAVGQVPDYACMITEWVKEVARTPVLVKLTPNITDIRMAARAARRGGADALSAINTINSITGIDLDTFTPRPNVGGLSSHGGYCGPAVKPIALHLVQQIASDPEVGLPISGIGGISGWREAAEFILLGCGTVQVCTAAMHYGYRIVEDMIDGLGNWMDEKGFRTIEDFRGLSVPKITEWKHLDLELPHRRAHQSRNLHRLRSLLRRLLGRRAPVHPLRQHQRPPRHHRDPRLQARSTARHRRPHAPRAHPPRGRRRMCRLQSLLAGLPGRKLHHHGEDRNRPSHRNLGPEDHRMKSTPLRGSLSKLQRKPIVNRPLSRSAACRRRYPAAAAG